MYCSRDYNMCAMDVRKSRKDSSIEMLYAIHLNLDALSKCEIE